MSPPAGRDGICANVQFPFPGRLVGAAVAAAAGVDSDTDPWLPERAVWPLLDVIEECLAEPWLGDLAAHLGGAGPDQDPVRRTRRFATARHIADLYDRYGVHRPEMLLSWAAGDVAAATTNHWQAQLWRHLRRRIGTPSPAERLAGACIRLRADAGLVALPRRLSLFGLTRLPATYLQVLCALAGRRQVHLFLLHPSPELWDRVAKEIAARPPVVRRADDPTAALPRNLLLTSWGQDVREMQLVLAAAEAPAVDHHWPLDQRSSTLLGRIQADVRADRALGGASAVGWRRCPSPPRPRGRQPSGPRLPWPGPSGRGRPRRHPAPPRRGPHPRSPRHDRDVPGHRDVRAAHPGHVRCRRWR